MKKAKVFPATIEKIETLSDKTLKLRVSTNRELRPEEELEILQLKQQEGYMAFVPHEVEGIEVPDEPIPEFRGDKSPGQRLRAVLYLLWKQTSKTQSSDEFYKDKMEQIIIKLKEKLD